MRKVPRTRPGSNTSTRWRDERERRQTAMVRPTKRDGYSAETVARGKARPPLPLRTTPAQGLSARLAAALHLRAEGAARRGTRTRLRLPPGARVHAPPEDHFLR